MRKVEDVADRFDNATFYGTDDTAETLSASTPEESIQEWIDSMCDYAGQPVADLFRAYESVTVYAWDLAEMPTTLAASLANDIRENVLQTWAEEYGDPDGGDTDGDDDLEMALEAVIQRWLNRQRVWCCDVVGQREYTTEDLLAMAKREGWMDDATCE